VLVKYRLNTIAMKSVFNKAGDFIFVKLV